MADIKLFQIQSNAVRELRAESVDIEKSLQCLMEQHLEAFLGVRFVASEYITGKVHGGRIDTLGLDDNNCPVIIEYKRALNENVISQERELNSLAPNVSRVTNAQETPTLMANSLGQLSH